MKLQEVLNGEDDRFYFFRQDDSKLIYFKKYPFVFKFPEKDYLRSIELKYSPEGIETIEIFSLNQEGIAKFSIEPGTYAFISTDKLLPLSELKKKYHINDQLHYTNGSDACFELWKSKNDLILNITKDTVISYVQKRKCWTGNNPCLEYTGPAAP